MKGIIHASLESLMLKKINENKTDLEDLNEDDLKIISKRLFNPEDVYGNK